MIYVIALIIALAFIIVGIVRWKIHPFFVLLLAAIAYGFITGMGVNEIISSVNDGFGSIMGKIWASSFSLASLLGLFLKNLVEPSLLLLV